MKRLGIILGIIFLVFNVYALNDDDSVISDSLFKYLKPYLLLEKDYYVVGSRDMDDSNQLIETLVSKGFSVVEKRDFADYSIEFDIKNKEFYQDRTSFLVSRKEKFQEINVSYKITEVSTEKIVILASKKNISKVDDASNKTSLWKPFALSLILGSLVYSLWAIE